MITVRLTVLVMAHQSLRFLEVSFRNYVCVSTVKPIACAENIRTAFGVWLLILVGQLELVSGLSVSGNWRVKCQSGFLEAEASEVYGNIVVAVVRAR